MTRVGKRGGPRQFGKELKINMFKYFYCYLFVPVYILLVFTVLYNVLIKTC